MSFYMNFGIINEGEQAEAYKKKKAEEISQNGDKYVKRITTKNGNTVLGHTGRSTISYTDRAYHNPNLSKKDFVEKQGEDLKIRNKADNIAKKYIGLTKDDEKTSFHDDKALKKLNKKELAADAVRRHMRRHPEAYKEFGIFAEACFIDE